MKRLLAIIVLALFVSACAPAEFMNAKEKTIVSGTCDVEQIGWEIAYDPKWEKHTFIFWVEGGTCDYD